GPWPIASVSIQTLPGQAGSTRSIKVCFVNVRVHLPSRDDPFNAGTMAAIIKDTSMNQSVVIYNGTSWSSSPAWTLEYDVTSTSDSTTIHDGNLVKIT